MWIDAQVLKKCHKTYHHEVFVPTEPVIVLGRSNRPEVEVHLEAARLAGISVLKRAGGGGTVLLYPGCFVVSVGTWVTDLYENSWYFKAINQALINTMAELDPKLNALGQSGYSDIVWGDKKVGGTSLFRSRHYLLYQASVLYNLDVRAISTYLAHPSKEPDYRQNRRHEDFLIGLGQITNCPLAKIVEGVKKSLEQHMMLRLSERLGVVDERHTHHILRKAAEGDIL